MLTQAILGKKIGAVLDNADLCYQGCHEEEPLKQAKAG
jgi:hypothetical protein